MTVRGGASDPRVKDAAGNVVELFQPAAWFFLLLVTAVYLVFTNKRRENA